jgi:purine nucleosidase
MGGPTGRGNTEPYAEFNVLVDPEAAEWCFAAGCRTSWHGLHVTHQATATADAVARIEALGTLLSTICVELLTFFRHTYRTLFGLDDPPAATRSRPGRDRALIDPACVRTAALPMRIKLRGEHTRGATVIDTNTGWEPNAVVGLHRASFWDLLIEAIDRLGAAAARPST